VLATGDHQQDRWLNYTYQNRFRLADYVDSAVLYHRLRPQPMISGHSPPIHVDDEFLDDITVRGATLERLTVWLPGSTPTKSTILPGARADYRVAIRNPFPERHWAVVQVVAPPGWMANPERLDLEIGLGTSESRFTVTPPPGTHVRRARIAVDLTVAGRRFGQQAEALVTVPLATIPWSRSWRCPR
jgi:hypothetical protein